MSKLILEKKYSMQSKEEENLNRAEKHLKQDQFTFLLLLLLFCFYNFVFAKLWLGADTAIFMQVHGESYNSDKINSINS